MNKSHSFSHGLILLLIAAVFVAGCASAGSSVRQPSTAETSAESPCSDSLFVQLKRKSLDEMTDREYEYFKRKDEACDEYLAEQKEKEPNRESIDQTTVNTAVIAAAILIGGTIIMFIAN